MRFWTSDGITRWASEGVNLNFINVVIWRIPNFTHWTFIALCPIHGPCSVTGAPKKRCSLLIYTHFPPLLSPAFGMSNSELRQSSKGNIPGGASYPSFGRRPHSPWLLPFLCFSPALLCSSETPRLDWNAEPPAQRTVVYSSLRHQSFQYNKIYLAFLGFLFFLPHPSSIYPAFVCFSSAHFPPNSSFLPPSCSRAFVRSLRRNQSWHPASAVRGSVLGVLSLCSHIFILRAKKYWILSEHASCSSPPHFFFIRSTPACSNKRDFWENWRGITWRTRSQSETFRSERRKFEAKQSLLCSAPAFAEPGGSGSGLEDFDFLIDGRMLKT